MRIVIEHVAAAAFAAMPERRTRSGKARSLFVLCSIMAASALRSFAQVASGPDDPLPHGTLFHLDFSRGAEGVALAHGAHHNAELAGGVLEFTDALQYAGLEFSNKLDGLQAASIGGWFFPRRAGEGAFLFRGMPEIAPLGERRFPPADHWVNFFLGTDQHGFFMGCINGNSEMPFPLVTLDEPGIDAWHQLVLVKDAQGGQKFYHNGVLVHTDADSCWAGKVWPFRDTVKGEPLRLAMPQGGLIGEVWLAGRELSAAQVSDEFAAKKSRYHPAIPPRPVLMRPMDEHPSPTLWQAPVTKESWPGERERILRGVMKVLGPFPDTIEPLEPRTQPAEDCGAYSRQKISIQVQPGDRMPAWLLVPKNIKRKAPAILCFYGTTGGAGKDVTVGLSGPTPGSPPRKNRGFAVDMAEAGFVALAPDYLRDGERLPPSGKPYDTTDFYQRFPNWSCVGKDVWDSMRAVDYLQTLPFVDAEHIGMVGHSYGGHSTIFVSALEPRIKAAFASGPVSDFLHHGIHWGVAPGSKGSASLPGLRPYVLDHTLPLPVTFYEFTSLIAPRPLTVVQAVGERRPMEEENAAAVQTVYRTLGFGDRVSYQWVAGDHDFPPCARNAAVAWFRKWLLPEQEAQ